MRRLAILALVLAVTSCAPRIRFAPVFEMREEPMRRNGEVVGTRMCRRFVGYEPVEVSPDSGRCPPGR